jgi:signal transduction histidine kinase/ActR/RegA family two-component response regulator
MRPMAGGKWADNLRGTEELFRTTVENLPINLVLYDREYRILYMNPTLAAICAAICQRPPDELVGLRGADLWPPQIWAPLFEHTERAVATRERQTYELATNLPGRGPNVREWTVVPLVGAAGEVDRILTMSLDVTAQRRMVQELRDADQRKSEFIAVLSHELRNPLAAVRLSLHVLENGEPGSEEVAGARRIIDRQVGQLVHLVDDLLDVTRITQKKIQLQRHRLDVNELVRATIEDNRAHLERSGVTIEAGLARAPIYVNADGVRIAQVLTNLLANAVNFTPSGGIATVTVSSLDAEGLAILRVSDTGSGIDADLLPKLFEPFMQSDRPAARSGGGLGLGLALVKGLVELHGGTVSASSAGRDLGAEFVVRLPLDTQAAAGPRAGSLVRPALRGRRMLLIEDDEDVASAMQTVLEMAGHEVAVAGNGPDGIAAARVSKPEVVLCDIGLPGMDGYEVARRIRADASLRGTFLVALSGYAQVDDVAAARAAGFDEHMAKPPSAEKIQRILAAFRSPATPS